MEAVFPAGGSALARGRRRRAPPRQRHRTAPVTFAEIEEVDEEQVCEEREVCGGGERRRRPDQLVELSREFAEFRRRRARSRALAEPDEGPPEAPPAPAPAPPAHGQLLRAASEPTE